MVACWAGHTQQAMQPREVFVSSSQGARPSPHVWTCQTCGRPAWAEGKTSAAATKAVVQGAPKLAAV